MCQNLGAFVFTLVCLLASGDEIRTREKVRGLTKIGNTEAALQKGVNECRTDSNATLCGTSPVTWVMSEECKKNPLVKQSCSFSCSPSGQLQGAAWRGSIVGVEQSLAAGANPLCQKTFTGDYTFTNMTAIHLAASANQQWIVKKLLDIGVDVNLQTTEGRTPTYDASQNGSIDSLNILIGHNANVNIPDTYGLTSLMTAALYGHLSVAKVLINANASIDVTGGRLYNATALYYASVNNHYDIVLLLIEHNANVNIPDTDGWTSLIRAAWYGHLSVAKVLINANASIDVTGGQFNATALYHASNNNHYDIALLLIEHNANVNIPAHNGWTSLIRASQHGHLSVAKALINANASIDVTGGWDNATALYYAASRDHQDVALLLLESGADPMITDAEGRTPAAAARDNGHNQLAALIESYITTGAQGDITAS